MELRAYLALLRRWLWLSALLSLLAMAGSYLYSRHQPALYAATSLLLLNTADATATGPEYGTVLTSERLAHTYAALFLNRSSLGAAVEELGFYPAGLRVSATPRRDTSLLALRVESTNPFASAFIANVLPGIVASQQRERQQQRAAEASAQILTELEAVERRLAGGPQASDVTTRSELEQLSYRALVQNLAAVRIASSRTLSPIEIIEEATAPARPFSPHTRRNGLLALLVGAVAGLGIGVLRELLDDRVQPSDDFAPYGLNKLGEISLFERARDRSSTDRQRQLLPTLEAYRMLRTNLRFSLIDDRHAGTPTIVLTSPAPGEGKSTTAANLAIVLAQAGQRVILIDADLRRPTQHTIFRQSSTIGLTNALIEPERSPESFLRPTMLEGLSLLASGPLPPNPAELLGSARMRALLVSLEKMADIIVLDSPPILSVSDSTMLASHASGTILVLRARQTQRETVARSLAQLQAVQARVLGIVMNGVPREETDHLDYYYSASRADLAGRSLEARPSLTDRMRARVVSVVSR